MSKIWMGRKMPKGKFGCIVVDPPWPNQGRLESKWGGNTNGVVKSISVPYDTISIDDIISLPVGSMAAKASHLYLWVVNRYVPDAYVVVNSWGFKVSTMLTWCKAPMGLGMGGTYVQTTEHLLFCRRGTWKSKCRIDSTWFPWTRTKHSVKPPASYGMIESVSKGPYLELFARRNRAGWTTWGDEV